MRTSRSLLRTGAVLAGASTAVLLAAAPVGADEDARAELDSGSHINGYHVNVDDHTNMSTSLFGLDLSGGNSLQAYCVEISVAIDPDRPLNERPWDSFPNEDSPFHENRNKINWVLHHGFPAVSVADLEKVVAEGGAEFNGGLDRREAITATQAAVWHYSDDQALDKKNPLAGKDNEKAGQDVVAVYEYLTGDANVGVGDQPAPALEVTPKSIEGTAGERLGPFSVETTGEITDVTTELPDGVKVTNAEGGELAEDATEFYVEVPEDAEAGEAHFSFTVSAHLDTGRLFVSKGYQKKPAQSLIVASSEKTSLTQDVTASWKVAPTKPPETTTTAPPTTTTTEASPAPPTETSVTPQAESGDLADTGVSIMTPILIGAGLLVLGAGLVLLQRRRRNA